MTRILLFIPSTKPLVMRCTKNSRPLSANCAAFDRKPATACPLWRRLFQPLNQGCFLPLGYFCFAGFEQNTFHRFVTDTIQSRQGFDILLPSRVADFLRQSFAIGAISHNISNAQRKYMATMIAPESVDIKHQHGFHAPQREIRWAMTLSSRTTHYRHRHLKSLISIDQVGNCFRGLKALPARVA
jgi:hypothetical protein